MVSNSQSCNMDFFPGVSFKLHSTRQARLFSKNLQPLSLTAYYIKYFSIRQPLVWIKKWKRLRAQNSSFLSPSNITHVFRNLLLHTWKHRPSAASPANLFTACLGFSSLSMWINLCTIYYCKNKCLLLLSLVLSITARRTDCYSLPLFSSLIHTWRQLFHPPPLFF